MITYTVKTIDYDAPGYRTNCLYRTPSRFRAYSFAIAWRVVMRQRVLVEVCATREDIL